MRASAVGGAGVHMMPLAEWEGETLSYPVGVADLEALTGVPFDADALRETPMYVYVGADDTNDPVGTLNPAAAAQVTELFGETVQARFAAAAAVYASAGAAGVFEIYPGVGHAFTDDMVADVTAFLAGHMVAPDIRANGGDGPVTVDAASPVSVTVALDAHGRLGRMADWWITADTPFGGFSWVYPDGWRPGVVPVGRHPLFNIPQPFELLHSPLPAGEYVLYFAVDDNADGVRDATWSDSVTVQVTGAALAAKR